MKNAKKKSPNRKAQAAAEFAIVFGAIFFFLTAFFIAIQASNSDKIYQRKDVATKEVALTIQNEIALASDSSEGYARTFTLPPNIDGKAYEAKLQEGLVYVKTNDNKHAIALSISNVSNTPLPLTVGGNGNEIKKINNLVNITPLGP